jgi:hypothetical protein
MIVRIAMWMLKAGAVWLALLAGMVVGGMITGSTAALARAPDGPLTSEAAFLAVNGVHAVLLAALAAQARIRGVALALFLFTILFGVQTFLMQIETVFFNESFGFSWDAIAQGVAANTIGAALGAATAALVFRPAPAEAPASPGLIWRLPVVAAAYVCFYYAAGIVFVTGNEAARAFYNEFTGFSVAWLPAFQVARGLIWGFLALLIVRNLKGPLALRAALTALAFSLFAATQLLYPNPVMPWPVRFVHLMEMITSNAAFGALAAVVLGARWPVSWMKPTRRANA